MKKKPKIEITELFMAKAGIGNKGFDRCFHGTIRRETDDEGKPLVCSKIKVKDGYIYAKAEDQWVLGDLLDNIVLMVLDYSIHQTAGVTVKIAEIPFNLN